MTIERDELIFESRVEVELLEKVVDFATKEMSLTKSEKDTLEKLQEELEGVYLAW